MAALAELSLPPAHELDLSCGALFLPEMLTPAAAAGIVADLDSAGIWRQGISSRGSINPIPEYLPTQPLPESFLRLQRSIHVQFPRLSSQVQELQLWTDSNRLKVDVRRHSQGEEVPVHTDYVPALSVNLQGTATFHVKKWPYSFRLKPGDGLLILPNVEHWVTDCSTNPPRIVALFYRAHARQEFL